MINILPGYDPITFNLSGNSSGQVNNPEGSLYHSLSFTDTFSVQWPAQLPQALPSTISATFMLHWNDTPYSHPGSLPSRVGGFYILAENDDYSVAMTCQTTAKLLDDENDISAIKPGSYTGTGQATMQTPFGPFTARPGSATVTIAPEYNNLYVAFRMKTIAYEGNLYYKEWDPATGTVVYEGVGYWFWQDASYSGKWIVSISPDGSFTLNSNVDDETDSMELILTLS